MAKNQSKAEILAEFKERLENSEVAIMARYKGVNVAQVTDLRKRMRDQKIQFKVYKNTLAARVLAEAGLSAAAGYMDGPTVWAFSKDPVAPAKILKDFHKDVDAVDMNGGVLSGRVVSKAQLDALASLPPREVLLAQVVGTIAAPLRNLVGVLNAVPRNLVNVLDQIKKQKEETPAA